MYIIYCAEATDAYSCTHDIVTLFRTPPRTATATVLLVQQQQQKTRKNYIYLLQRMTARKSRSLGKYPPCVSKVWRKLNVTHNRPNGTQTLFQTDARKKKKTILRTSQEFSSLINSSLVPEKMHKKKSITVQPVSYVSKFPRWPPPTGIYTYSPWTPAWSKHR